MLRFAWIAVTVRWTLRSYDRDPADEPEADELAPAGPVSDFVGFWLMGRPNAFPRRSSSDTSSPLAPLADAATRDERLRETFLPVDSKPTGNQCDSHTGQNGDSVRYKT
ncbi:hypothetical protein GCM10009780_07790 [Actinomadura alba]